MATATRNVPTSAAARNDRAAALIAIAKWAEKEGDRDALEAGSSHDIRLEITGEIDGRKFHDLAAGQLLVNHDTQRSSSSGPKPAEVIALLLAELSKQRRQKLLEVLPDQYLQAGTLEVNQELLDDAERLLSRLRTTTTTPCRGSVRFEPAACP